MLTIDQCVKANRPFIFVVAESDMEVLRHLQDNHDNNFMVYSSTLADTVKLDTLFKNKFKHTAKQARSTIDVLSDINKREFKEINPIFETYIFLDCQGYIHDPQNIRKIKDIIARYQLDENFTVSLIFISQTVSVPVQLERISEVVFFDLPDEKELKNTSDNLATKFNLVKSKKPEDNTWPSDEVVNNLKGLTLSEVEQAYIQSFSLTKSIELDFIKNFKKSAIAKTDLLSLMETDVKFKDIGGLENLKQWVTKSYGGWTLEGKKYGLPLLKGLLLIGVPGTGKTLSAKALGNEWNLPVVQFDLSRVFSSRVGDTESNIRRVLKMLEDISPVIAFIDEIEKSLSGLDSSNFSDGGVTARMIGTFLTWFQECTKPVFVVGTANSIKQLPPELISRFSTVFFVNLPQHEERRDILNIHITKVGRDPKNFNIDELIKHSKGLSGREIEQVIQESLYESFFKKEELQTKHIIYALRKKTGIMVTMKEKIANLLDWVGWDSEKLDGVRARYASIPDNRDNVQSDIDAMLAEIEKNSHKDNKDGKANI